MPLQVELYKKFVETGISELGSSNGKFSQSALSVITSLKKLCNRKFQTDDIHGVDGEFLQ